MNKFLSISTELLKVYYLNQEIRVETVINRLSKLIRVSLPIINLYPPIVFKAANEPVAIDDMK